MVLGCLRSAPLREHAKYLGGGKRLPLRSLTTLTREDRIFAALQRAVPKPQSHDARKNTWILETTWRLFDERVSAHQDPMKDQALIWRLGRAIAASLKVDRRQQVEESGKEVETLLKSDHSPHWEAWYRLKGGIRMRLTVLRRPLR